MASPFDTIVAPITEIGGAVAVVRLSGPDSWPIAAQVFRPWPEMPTPRLALYGAFLHGDDGIALPFEQGHSYTGESAVELSVHGSRASVEALLEACVTHGARRARPGEFTERAFLNGRLDLTQAEGVRDTIEASTRRQLAQANLLRAGALRDEVRRGRVQLLEVLARIEATVDFSEEIGELDRAQTDRDLDAVESSLVRLLETAPAGAILRRGFRIAILGRPNVGKSSLLNALLGRDRSIVTEFAGTTRDFIEERVDLGGIPCLIADTAGLRETDEPVERIGIDWAHRQGAAADLVWFLYDSHEGWTDADKAMRDRVGREVWVLANKCDAEPAARQFAGALPISAQTRQGLDQLAIRVSAQLGHQTAGEVMVNERQAPLFESAVERIRLSRQTLCQDLPTDLASVHLQAAIDDLGQITGETASDNLLERIFRDFCIGK